jgi:hypothetical protein
MLSCPMKILSRLYLVILLEAFATASFADAVACKGCDNQKQERSARDQIKADRAKYDRENDLITARPWDRNKPETPTPDKTR